MAALKKYLWILRWWWYLWNHWNQTCEIWCSRQ